MIWEGICIRFSDEFFAMSSAENHSVFALSPKPSYLKNIFSIHTSSNFRQKELLFYQNLEGIALWHSRTEYPPPGRNIRGGGGQIIRANFSRNIRLVWRLGIKGRGRAARSGSSNPLRPGSSLPLPPPLPSRRRCSGHPLGRPSPDLDLLLLGKAFPKPFLQWTRVKSHIS
jgi:hypothetical protein